MTERTRTVSPPRAEVKPWEVALDARLPRLAPVVAIIRQAGRPARVIDMHPEWQTGVLV